MVRVEGSAAVVPQGALGGARVHQQATGEGGAAAGDSLPQVVLQRAVRGVLMH
jgi:hypothetical protein